MRINNRLFLGVLESITDYSVVLFKIYKELSSIQRMEEEKEEILYNIYKYIPPYISPYTNRSMRLPLSFVPLLLQQRGGRLPTIRFIVCDCRAGLYE